MRPTEQQIVESSIDICLFLCLHNLVWALWASGLLFDRGSRSNSPPSPQPTTACCRRSVSRLLQRRIYGRTRKTRRKKRLSLPSSSLRLYESWRRPQSTSQRVSPVSRLSIRKESGNRLIGSRLFPPLSFPSLTTFRLKLSDR